MQGGVRGRCREGVSQSPIPTEPTHLVKSGDSNIGDVVEGVHVRVDGTAAKRGG